MSRRRLAAIALAAAAAGLFGLGASALAGWVAARQTLGVTVQVETAAGAGVSADWRGSANGP
jgi:hypothetical protein